MCLVTVYEIKNIIDYRMIPVFKKVKQSIIESKKFRNYLIYAMGEILLVMIGILLALQVNNWNEERKLGKQESMILTEMNKNLKLDLTHFETQQEAIKSRLVKVDHLYNSLINGDLEYSDSLHAYFGAVYGVENIDLNTANYDDLKSRGFDLITDDSLRFEINQFYEKAIAKVIDYEVSEKAVNDEMKPFYLRNFTQMEFRKTAIPIDIDDLINDAFYHNLVYYRKINLESNQLTHHPWIIQGMKDLIQRIDDHLK